MDAAAFLKTVITTDEGFFSLLIGPPSGTGWHEEWFNWPADIDKIVATAQRYKDANNVYFTSHLFDTTNSNKDHVLPSRTIQADLDEAIPSANRPPTVLVETSPGRHQGFWLLRETTDPSTLEGLSRGLTYSIPWADKSGWSLGHKMRMPDTLNHKYTDGPKPVHVVSSTLTTYSFDFEAPAVLDTSWVPAPFDGSLRELWASVRKNLPKKVRDEYDRRQPDRSKALWLLMTSLFRSGVSRDAVYALAGASANNKFADNKYHSEEDLQKDVLRAERAIAASGDVDGLSDKERLQQIKKIPGPIDERRSFIAEYVRDRLMQLGTFISTEDGQDWYTLEEEGRPTTLARRNDHLASILETRFGLNAVESEQKYTINLLISKAKSASQRGTLGIMSHYDPLTNLVLLHTGGRDVLHIDGKGISHAVNGDLGVIFPWRANETSFEPDFKDPLPIESLFTGCFDNLIEMEPTYAVALVHAWMLFLLLRTAAASRPLLALFGQPGSGKSTMFRRIYAFLYGRGKSVNSVTNPDDFDHAVSSDPFVVFDNVDAYTPWLPDKLALSAALSVLSKRKLYTDNDDIYVQRQALIGITAHNPQFRREDIVDRLLMFNFKRLEKFQPESVILTHIERTRNRMWGGLLNDLQAMLATQPPADEDVPAFRVNDFARIGLWAAQSCGFESDFRSAISTNTTEQLAFNLEEEDLLVETIKRWIAKRKPEEDETWLSVADLWAKWQMSTRDATSFERAYKNANKLGRKLWALHASLKAVFDIEFKFDEGAGKRLWLIRSRT